jgi:hypothetical protein
MVMVTSFVTGPHWDLTCAFIDTLATATNPPYTFVMQIRHDPIPEFSGRHPDVIPRTLVACRPPCGVTEDLIDIFGTFVANTIMALRARAYQPIRSIEMLDAIYNHDPEDLIPPAYPNGYPVILIKFNAISVAYAGILFQNTGQAEMTYGELRLAQLVLGDAKNGKAEPAR